MINPLLLLEDYFLTYNNITSETPYELDRMPASELLVPQRMDLSAKLYYIDSYMNNKSMTLARAVYKAHIGAFTDNTFREHGNRSKGDMETYFETFHEMIHRIKEKGVDETVSLIPVGKNNVILDGAHRVACAIYFNQSISLVRFKELSVNYDINFFKRRLMDSEYQLLMVNEYMKRKKDSRVRLVAKGQKVSQLEVLYRYSLKVNDHVSSIINKYAKDSWLSSPVVEILYNVNEPACTENQTELLDDLWIAYHNQDSVKKDLVRIIQTVLRPLKRSYRLTLMALKRVLGKPV